jgi:hypothetical protein
MHPGPIIYIECPRCNNIIRELSWSSWNTFGETVHWSDGKAESLMVPLFVKLASCRECEELFWLDEAKTVGEEVSIEDYMEWGEEYVSSKFNTIEEYTKEYKKEYEKARLKKELEQPKEWRNARAIKYAGIEDYNKALEQGLGDSDGKEMYLRLQLWWALNDLIRYENKKHPELFRQYEKVFQNNLEALDKLLDWRALNVYDNYDKKYDFSLFKQYGFESLIKQYGHGLESFIAQYYLESPSTLSKIDRYEIESIIYYGLESLAQQYGIEALGKVFGQIGNLINEFEFSVDELKILKAEIARELGDFDTCLDRLAVIPKYGMICNQIKLLAQQKIRIVQSLKMTDPS